MSQLHILCNVLTFRTLKCEIDLHSISHNITQRNPSPTPQKNKPLSYSPEGEGFAIPRDKAHPSPPKR